MAVYTLKRLDNLDASVNQAFSTLGQGLPLASSPFPGNKLLVGPPRSTLVDSRSIRVDNHTVVAPKLLLLLV